MSLFGSSYHEEHAAEKRQTLANAAEAPSLRAERDALAARVEELEAVIDRARGVLNDPLVRAEHARRRARLLLLRGEDE